MHYGKCSHGGVRVLIFPPEPESVQESYEKALISLEVSVCGCVRGWKKGGGNLGSAVSNDRIFFFTKKPPNMHIQSESGATLPFC